MSILAHLPSQPFQHHVTADDVHHLKPHPEPYLSALDLLGASAERTVVLEDSPAGVAAGEAAGCHVVAVPSVVPIESCTEGVPSLSRWSRSMSRC